MFMHVKNKTCLCGFSSQDYTHELICITEREKFLVPVKAVGARAILDFPDEISFGTCPVKVRQFNNYYFIFL